MNTQFSILAVVLLVIQTGDAQTNSWVGAVSGYWDDPHWSLGALPGTNQTILFTNAGWKALGITANTAQKFPQTMSVDSITISSPTNSFNTLLLSYVGFQTPLKVNALTVGSNAAVTMLSSALSVGAISAFGKSMLDAADTVQKLSDQLNKRGFKAAWAFKQIKGAMPASCGRPSAGNPRFTNPGSPGPALSGRGPSWGRCLQAGRASSPTPRA